MTDARDRDLAAASILEAMRLQYAPDVIGHRLPRR
jgi:hypothetical protein